MSFKPLTCRIIGHKFPDIEDVVAKGWICECERCGKELLTFVRFHQDKKKANPPPPAYTRAQTFTGV